MAKGATAGGTGAPPLSPHLQIWRWSITMAASITHRVSGVALYFGTLLLVYLLFTLTFAPAWYEFAIGVLSTWFGWIVFGGYAWALIFHMMNGLRHLYWDTGRGLGLKTATFTAWLIYVASFLAAALVVSAGVSAMGA